MYLLIIILRQAQDEINELKCELSMRHSEIAVLEERCPSFLAHTTLHVPGHSLTYPATHSLIHPTTHPLTHSPNHPPTHTLTPHHSLSHSHSHTHSTHTNTLTHSLTVTITITVIDSPSHTYLAGSDTWCHSVQPSLSSRVAVETLSVPAALYHAQVTVSAHKL